MKRITFILIIVSTFFYACSKKGSRDGHGNTDTGNRESNIPYLMSYHTNYKDPSGTKAPSPVKNNNTLSLEWSVSAKTKDDALKLRDHINFMTKNLENGETPRAWDKLFLLESYMKVEHLYTITVSIKNEKEVLITKTAINKCAFDVISAHSDAVSKDFFEQGIISKDYSFIAESIINNIRCASLKAKLESYIKIHLMVRGGTH